MTKDPSKVSVDMVACTKAQKLWLKKHGEFGETFADIIQRLIDHWEEGHKEKMFQKIVLELKRDADDKSEGG